MKVTMFCGPAAATVIFENETTTTSGSTYIPINEINWTFENLKKSEEDVN
jgi:hypothetical protein